MERKSKANLYEVALVYNYIETLISSGVSEFDIAVIAPYASQVGGLLIVSKGGNKQQQFAVA